MDDVLRLMGENINFPYQILIDAWAITVKGHGEKETRRLVYPNMRFILMIFFLLKKYWKSGAVNDRKQIQKFADLELLKAEINNLTIDEKVLDSRGKTKKKKSKC